MNNEYRRGGFNSRTEVMLSSKLSHRDYEIELEDIFLYLDIPFGTKHWKPTSIFCNFSLNQKSYNIHFFIIRRIGTKIQEQFFFFLKKARLV